MATEDKQKQRRSIPAAIETNEPPTIVPAATPTKPRRRKSNGPSANGNGNGNNSGNGQLDGNSAARNGNRHVGPLTASPAGISLPDAPFNQPNPLFLKRFGAMTDLIGNIGNSLAHVTDPNIIAQRAASILGEAFGVPNAIWRLQPIIEHRDPTLSPRRDRRHLALAAAYNLDPTYRQHITTFAERVVTGNEAIDIVERAKVVD